MTQPYDQLKESPQIDVDIAQMAADERILVRQIQIKGTIGVTASNSPGRFTGVYYLAGDE